MLRFSINLILFLRMIAAVLNRVTVISRLSFLDVFCFLFESTFGPTFIIFAVLSSNKDLSDNPPRFVLASLIWLRLKIVHLDNKQLDYIPGPHLGPFPQLICHTVHIWTWHFLILDSAKTPEHTLDPTHGVAISVYLQHFILSLHNWIKFDLRL